jgi:quercetin dioxygenase-like cupin family protein
MTIRMTPVVVAVSWALTANAALAQLAPRCVENSPERQGGVGCSIVETKALPTGLTGPLFWHIDRFDSVEGARSAVSPTSIAFDAAGTSWLFTIEADTSRHHGGHHVTQVGPLELPRAAKYAMLVQSAALNPGMYTAVHHHSGVEGIYVVEGVACYETPTRGFGLRKGDTLTIPGGTVHRAVVPGSSLRHVLAVIIHDAAQPPTMLMEGGAHPALAPCE